MASKEQSAYIYFPLLAKAVPPMKLENPVPTGYRLEEGAFLLCMFVIGRGKCISGNEMPVGCTKRKIYENKEWEETKEEKNNSSIQTKKETSIRSSCPLINVLG